MVAVSEWLGQRRGDPAPGPAGTQAGAQHECARPNLECSPVLRGAGQEGHEARTGEEGKAESGRRRAEAAPHQLPVPSALHPCAL